MDYLVSWYLPLLHSTIAPQQLLRPDVLELAWRIGEVVGVRFRGECASLGLLNEVFVSLLFRKPDSILLRVEEYVGSLHHIA